MPRIDFYILKNQPERAGFVCRLLHKAYLNQHHIYVHCDCADSAAQLDNLLWTFHDISFVPHALAPAPTNLAQTPIIIGHMDAAPESMHDILINLASEVPSFYERFEHVIEIVPAQDPWRNQARQHYAHYRDQGLALNTHEINA